ncbi:MAG: hypothetical protein LW721_01350 [Flammeovirgaceae bacterium]|nr:hypothetical protein [Flammeovirgaceae bacterium]
MRFSYIIIIALLSVIDALLLAKPNFLGKIGLWVFKYSYLRTFPRALITVSIVVGTAFLIGELIVFLGKKKWIKKNVGLLLLLIFFLAASGILAKVIHDFSKGIYSHTGVYFRYGVFLLPGILLLVFATSFFRLSSKRK